ncbi:hypothetical protein OSB04_000335 [Centaurea solstitialis]|uniref:Uncharacterized protein n=1 Tax=Centaurea solstitialis TaxID=347529 RepID=A0AA38TQM9_9ASTR|nr:hypothetical protein OSB04_000335 [Centaurea solstitialis]
MAIHLCSENSGTGANNVTMSPRISFSHDLSHSDTVPVEQLLRSLSSSNVDFNFCVQQNHASMADELFSDGKIIATQIKQRPPPPPQPPQSPPNNRNQPPPMERSPSRSFWGFKRSSSCGNGYARSLCPIPLLSRSNSTGSSSINANTKRSTSSSKEGFTQKHNHHNFQKPPLRKTSYRYGNHANGARINPVLNLGFGSFFSNGKKKMKS